MEAISSEVVPSRSGVASSHSLPVGSCDLGGESLEIGYFARSQSASPIALSSSVSPIARSFSALGAQRAVEAVLDKLNYTSDGTVEHPCYPAGFSERRGGRVLRGTGEVGAGEAVDRSLSGASRLCGRCLGRRRRKPNWRDFSSPRRGPCFMECLCFFTWRTSSRLPLSRERMELAALTECCIMPPNSWIR